MKSTINFTRLMVITLLLGMVSLGFVSCKSQYGCPGQITKSEQEAKPRI